MASAPDTRPSARAPVVRVALASCIGIALLSCGGGDGAAPISAPPSTPTTPPPPAAPTVASLEVSGTAVLTSIGETTQFMVSATLSDGLMQAVEAAEADWEILRSGGGHGVGRPPDRRGAGETRRSR